MRQLLRLSRKRMRVEGWQGFLNYLNKEMAGTEDEVAEVFAEALRMEVEEDEGSEV